MSSDDLFLEVISKCRKNIEIGLKCQNMDLANIEIPKVEYLQKIEISIIEYLNLIEVLNLYHRESIIEMVIQNKL